jgi:hypothetical protein
MGGCCRVQQQQQQVWSAGCSKGTWGVPRPMQQVLQLLGRNLFGVRAVREDSSSSSSSRTGGEQAKDESAAAAGLQEQQRRGSGRATRMGVGGWCWRPQSLVAQGQVSDVALGHCGCCCYCCRLPAVGHSHSELLLLLLVASNVARGSAVTGSYVTWAAGHRTARHRGGRRVHTST